MPMVSIRLMIQKLVQWHRSKADDASGCSSTSRERPAGPEDMDVSGIKTLVQQGRYEVDSYLVADAIVSRMLGQSSFAERRRDDQNWCSKPDRSPLASRKRASG